VPVALVGLVGMALAARRVRRAAGSPGPEPARIG
jgi:hypothetical protein